MCLVENYDFWSLGTLQVCNDEWYRNATTNKDGILLVDAISATTFETNSNEQNVAKLHPFVH